MLTVAIWYLSEKGTALPSLHFGHRKVNPSLRMLTRKILTDMCRIGLKSYCHIHVRLTTNGYCNIFNNLKVSLPPAFIPSIPFFSSSTSQRFPLNSEFLQTFPFLLSYRGGRKINKTFNLLDINMVCFAETFNQLLCCWRLFLFTLGMISVQKLYIRERL